MERLTGFRFEILHDPGPMQIRVEKTDEISTTVFGTKKPQKPRFAVLDAGVTGSREMDRQRAPAFASKSLDGWTSIMSAQHPLLWTSSAGSPGMQG